MADITEYQKLITSEHSDKPKFMAFVSGVAQPIANDIETAGNLYSYFDIDQAIGAQLDIIGLWVGQSRYLTTPLVGVYLTLDTGPGLDSGALIGPFDATTGLTTLGDDTYRVLLKAKIANNQWDGTTPGAYAFMNAVFPGDVFFIIDYQDMTMDIGVAGPLPLNAVVYALLTGGYLNIRPATVAINNYITPSVYGSPMFELDAAPSSPFAGLDSGAFANFTPGS